MLHVNITKKYIGKFGQPNSNNFTVVLNKSQIKQIILRRFGHPPRVKLPKSVLSPPPDMEKLSSSLAVLAENCRKKA